MHRLVFYIVILLPLISHAYIGPGMAGGLIAAIFGIILAIIRANIIPNIAAIRPPAMPGPIYAWEIKGKSIII